MSTANPPHLAALGTYGFCSYMCVPAPPAVLPGFEGEDGWTPIDILRAWWLRRNGLGDLFRDFVDLAATQAHLPTGVSVPDPLWSNNESFRGYAIAARADAQPAFPPYLRVFNGIVAYYSDLQGDENTVITYYADDRGLETYLASQFATSVPALSTWGVGILALLLLTTGVISIRVKPRLSS